MLMGWIWYYAYIFYQENKTEAPVPSLPAPEAPVEITEPVSTITEPREPKLWDEKIQKDISEDNAVPETSKPERVEMLIKKADFLWANNEYTEAFQLYERALRLSPSSDTERKLAHIAFKSKKFQKSADLYKKNIDILTLGEKQEFMWALRYTGDEDFSVALANMALPDYMQAAFEVSVLCEREFISCENAIRNYKYDYAPIRDLKNALKNYEALGNKDTNYKEALLIGAWYKNGDYTTAIKIGENLLRRKPDYRPILKIVWFSSYMIGSYDRSQAALSKYKKYEPKDPEADFLLGLIHFEKWDYETSNIFFNNAVLWGYKPKTVVERKLAYNYYVLGLTKNMFQVLWYLVLEPDITQSDMSNAVYLALTNDEIRSAGEWLKQGLTKFPNSLDLLALNAWYLRSTNNTHGAQIIIDGVLAKNPNHLVWLVQAGILAYNSGDKVKASEYLKKAKIIDAGGVWSEMIDEYLWRIQEKH